MFDKSFYNALIKSNTSMEFEVGGKKEDFNNFEFFEQSNPHPGDIRYVVTINNPPFHKVFKDFKKGCYDPSDYHSVFAVFSNIGHVKHFLNLINNKKMEKPHKYFINTIEKLKVLDNQVVIEGICTKIPNRD